VPPSNQFGLRTYTNIAKGVVLKMVDGMENKRHIVVIDNYFISVDLFTKLLDRGTYTIGIVRNNCIGLLLELANIKEFDKNV
jgi:hypothetical protein